MFENYNECSDFELLERMADGLYLGYEEPEPLVYPDESVKLKWAVLVNGKWLYKYPETCWPWEDGEIAYFESHPEKYRRIK